MFIQPTQTLVHTVVIFKKQVALLPVSSPSHQAPPKLVGGHSNCTLCDQKAREEPASKMVLLNTSSIISEGLTPIRICFCLVILLLPVTCLSIVG